MRVQMTLGEQLRAKFEEAAKKEELKATLNEWDQDEQRQIKGEDMAKKTFNVTNNASRDTFNYVRDNAGKRIAEVKAGLPHHKAGTVASLVYQMVMAGLIRKDENTSGFYALADEFKPFSINKVRRQKKQEEAAERKLVIVKRRTAQEAEAAHNANLAGIGALASRPRPWRPEDVVDTLTLGQAIAVHKHLQQLFGAAQ